jgi:NAD(P)-dependent dehydrogenase (short-subunit alcohol dehydrogenase family)
MTPFDLTGRTVLVAGGAGYLALPAAQLMGRLGANVVLADIDAARLEAAGGAVRNAGAPNVLTQTLDLADEASILACVRAAADRFGDLRGVVNATFGSTGKRFDDLTVDDFDRANHLNLTGSFVLAREAAKYMPNGGSMVMYASMYGLVAPRPDNYPPPMAPNPIEYGAGKAGMIQMVRYMAAHFGPRNIRVNAVAPGPFPHQATQDASARFIDNLAHSTMLGRIGRRDEMAGPTLFLLSDAASYITGQCLNVDGGWTAW